MTTTVSGRGARAVFLATILHLSMYPGSLTAEPEGTPVEASKPQAESPTSAVSSPPAPPDGMASEAARKEGGTANVAPEPNVAGPTATDPQSPTPPPSDAVRRQRSPVTLTIASWGAAYGRSQKIAYFEPFETETGNKITSLTHGGRDGSLDRLGKADAPAWDVVDLGSHMLETACEAGRLDAIDHGMILKASGGATTLDDFLPGALHKCGIASVAWSSVVVFDTRAFQKRKPSTVKDFFDLKRFPGKRSLRESAKYSLELALMADGVAPADVYATLATGAGVDRAFAMLDTIKDSIVWWTRGREPLRHLAEKEVTMATAFNGRVFYGAVAESAHVGIVWDGQIYDTDHWAIPKEAANKAAALEFIAFALRPDRLATQARWLPYGPMRKSALAMVAKHAEADVDMKPFIPTMSENFTFALKLDEAWWDRHGPVLIKRFQAWRTAAAASGAEATSE